MKRNLPVFITLMVITLMGNSVQADLFRAYDLHFAGKFYSYHVEDLNNDGMRDIIIFDKRGKDETKKERWLSIYFQNQQGFPSNPGQSFRLPDDVIVFDIGDVAGDHKKEFVYFAPGGVYYFVLADSGFVLKPIRLFNTESIFMIPDPSTILIWDFVSDLNGDYLDEVIVPRFKRCDIYFRRENGTTWVVNQIPLSMESHVFGYYSPRFSVGLKADALYSIPFLLFDDFNADGRKDLIGVYRDSLLVFCQEVSGFFSQRYLQKIPIDYGSIWRGAKIIRVNLGDQVERKYLMRIRDLNHDGILDIVSLRISTEKSIVKPETDLSIFFGKRDTTDSAGRIYFSQEPDQIIKPDGTMLVVDIWDFNHDGRLDLLLPVVKVGITRIIKMLLTKTAEVEASFYLMNAEGRYPEKPDFSAKMVVKFTLRGGASSPVYEIADFNADGNLDILSSLEEKRLVLFWGKEQGVVQSTISANYHVLLPQDGELVKAIDLNGDKKSDVIITYEENDASRKKLRNTLKVLLAN